MKKAISILYFLGTIILSIALSGCYGDIYITSQFPESGKYNTDTSEVYFYHFAQVARPAMGITAFPDGGISKILFRNLSLYQYIVKSGTIKTVFDFGQLPYNYSRWKYIVFSNPDSLIFKISPLSGWQKEMEWGLDSSLFAKYNTWFVVNNKSGEVSAIDSLDHSGSDNSVISITELKILTEDIKYIEWGIDLDKIYPSPMDKRIKKLVELRGNKEYRDAIIEQTGQKIDNKEVNKIIGDINKNLKNLSSYERLEKELPATETISKLQELLK